MINVNIISTGSCGNCVVIDDRIMFDAGLSKKKISESGYNLDHLEHLYISHKHADHTNLPFIRWALNNDIDVHLPQDVIDKLVDEGRIDVNEHIGDNLTIHNPREDMTVTKDTEETYNISVHPQKHYDIVNYAFVLEKTITNENNETTTERLLYSTDLDTVEPTDVGPGLVTLGKFDVLILEGNFDELWLRDYINMALSVVDPEIDGAAMTDKDLDHWVRENYRALPNDISAGMFRAVQNMRHLSKQQARLYAANHLRRGGRYYEVHRSNMFYERPSGMTE